jgi:hypothetical protein
MPLIDTGGGWSSVSCLRNRILPIRGSGRQNASNAFGSERGYITLDQRVVKRLPFFKDPPLVDVRVVRNRAVRVPTDRTNFRHRIASLQERGDTGVLRLVETHPAQALTFGFFVNRLAERRQGSPAVKNPSRLLGRPHRFDRFRMKRNPAPDTNVFDRCAEWKSSSERYADEPDPPRTPIGLLRHHLVRAFLRHSGGGCTQVEEFVRRAGQWRHDYARQGVTLAFSRSLDRGHSRRVWPYPHHEQWEALSHAGTVAASGGRNLMSLLGKSLDALTRSDLELSIEDAVVIGVSEPGDKVKFLATPPALRGYSLWIGRYKVSAG